MQELQNMMIFAKVLECGSFSKAAEQLGMAKSSVSKKINELEKEFGVRLIQRSTRKLNVTEEGQSLYQRCRQISQALEMAKQELTLYHEAPQGTLRISVSPLFGNTIIAGLIPGFLEQFPLVSVELNYAQELSDLIGEGYDLSLRMGTLADSSLVAVELFTVKFMLCASQKYLKKAGRPQHPSEITNHNYIRWLAPNRPAYDSLVFHKKNREYTYNINSRFSSNDAQATLEAVLNGGGLAMLPNYAICQEIQNGRLEALLPEYKVQEMPISLVYPQRKHIPPKVRVFSQYLKKRLTAKDFSALKPNKTL